MTVLSFLRLTFEMPLRLALGTLRITLSILVTMGPIGWAIIAAIVLTYFAVSFVLSLF